MITEDRVTFEIAKLLEEKGFKGEFKGYYDCNGFYFDTPNIVLKESGYAYYPIPSLSVVLKWLREVHNIYIAVNITYSEEPKLFPPEYYVYINNTLTGESLIKEVCSLVQDKTLTPKGFKRSETACEAAIKYALENLI